MNGVPLPTPPSDSGYPKKVIHWAHLKENLTGCLFVLPAFIIIGVFGLFPIGFAAYVSLFQWRINPGKYIALDNYTKAMGSLAYVIFFWLVLLFLYIAWTMLRKLWITAREHKENPLPWFLPAALIAGGVVQLVRYAVLLLPAILDISQQVRGQQKTQELFVRLLGEAFRLPHVQSALNLSLLLLILGMGSAYLLNRYLHTGARNTYFLAAFVQIGLLLVSAAALGWLTWTYIQAAYTLALESGEKLSIWTQVITISAGFVLLFLSWYFWRTAGGRSSNLSLALRVIASVCLAIGAWVLIAELPAAVAAGNKDWWDSLEVTVYYSIGTVPVQLAISLILATMLFQNIKGKALFRLIYFLPYITPAVASAAIFRVFFSGRPTAPLNSLLRLFGIDSLLWLDEPKGILQMLVGQSIQLPDWAVGPSLALVVIIIYNIWSYVGYDTVVFLAGLGSIPGELYEAAAIDGAGRIAQFRHITFPLLSPTTYFLTLLSVIGTFKAFNHVWVLRSGAALGTVDTATILIFTEFTRNTRYGYAAALSIVLLLVILILTIINNRVAESRVFYG